jgi:choline dehydrogenase
VQDGPHSGILRRGDGQPLQVHGTRSLRVVDASVFPKIPGFFIASGGVAMVSEEASDA